MVWRTGARLLCAAAVLLAAPVSAGAKPKPITGKLSKPGYTVIALAADGEARSERTQPRTFRLRPPAKRVTLHLRAKDGTYAGPIVIGKEKRGKRAILGIKAGAKLGSVEVNAGKGYAKVKKKLAKEFVDAKRKARAKRGVPIGAGEFGRVLSKNFKGGAPGDRDLDGIPGALDVDDDGDLILDNFDQAGGGRASQADPPHVGSRSALWLELDDTVNANAGSTSEEIEAALSHWGKVIVWISNLRPDAGTLPELDCAGDAAADPPRPGLAYCSAGGTGRIDPSPFTTNEETGDRFPQCCDGDRNGFGDIPVPSFAPAQPGEYGLALRHGATTAEIHSGDVWIARALLGGVMTEFPGAVTYVFATPPAVAAYSDEAGHAGSVTYPVPPGAPGTGPQPGMRATGFPVADGPDDGDSDVEVTLTLWRPQRPSIAGESGAWQDIGHVAYSARAAYAPGTHCPADAYSDIDPQLTPTTSQAGFGLVDSADDQAPDSARTLSFKLNLTKCHDANSGAPPFAASGDELQLELTGAPVASTTDSASTLVWFTRP